MFHFTVKYYWIELCNIHSKTYIHTAILFNCSLLMSQIGRALPLPNKDDHPQRTLVVEGFEEGEENVSIDSVSNLFSKYGYVSISEGR